MSAAQPSTSASPRGALWRAGRRVIAGARQVLSTLSAQPAPPAWTSPSAPPVSAPPAPPRRRYGHPGTRFTAGSRGRPRGLELNPDLQGQAGIAALEQMRLTDPMAGQIDRLQRDTLTSATFEWTPDDGDCGLCCRNADYANEAYGMGAWRGRGRLLAPWEESLAYIANYPPLGFRYLEEDYYVADGLVWLRAYEDCEPSAHEEWGRSADGRTLEYVRQRQVSGQPAPQPIPATKLVLFTLDRTGQNFEGRALLRRAYFFGQVKLKVSDLLIVACERFALGAPKVRTNWKMLADIRATNGGVDLPGLGDADIARMQANLEAVAAAYIASEESQLSDNDVVELVTHGTDALDVSGLLAVLDFCDQQIAASYLASFLRLGTTDTGAKNVGEVHASVFRRSCINLLDAVCGVIGGRSRPGGGTIGRLIEWNFGQEACNHLPRLTHYGLNADHLAESLSVLGSLVQAGALTPDDDLERRVRALFGLRLMPHCQRSVEERVAMYAASVAHKATDLARAVTVGAQAPAAAPQVAELSLPDEAPADLPPDAPLAKNADVRAHLGLGRGGLNGAIRRSLAAGIKVPAYGSAANRRWYGGPTEWQAWYAKVHDPGDASAEGDDEDEEGDEA